MAVKERVRQYKRWEVWKEEEERGRIRKRKEEGRRKGRKNDVEKGK